MRDSELKTEVLEFKRLLEQAGLINYIDRILFTPEMPLSLGYPKEFMIEEYYGIKVANLVGTPED